MRFGINKFHNLVCLVLGSSMFSYKQNGIDTVKKKPSMEGKKQSQLLGKLGFLNCASKTYR